MRRTPRGSAGPAALSLLLFFGGAGLAEDDGLPLPARKVATKAYPTEVTTSFDPVKDAPMFQNNGDYVNGMGDCYGMSLVAISNFLKRTQTGGTPDPNRPTTVANLAADGDLQEEEAAAVAATEANDKDGELPHRKAQPPSHPAPIIAALERIKASGVPEPLFIEGGVGRHQDGHVVVVFGYKDGKLQVYDPNAPGKTVEWPFDPKKGLGPNPLAKHDPEFYGHIQRVAMIPYHELRASKDLPAIQEACSEQAPACVDKFPRVTAKLAPAPRADQVVLSGTVSRGEKSVHGEPTQPPRIVWVKINGKLRQTPVRVAKDGTYKITLPRSAFTDTSDVSVVATTDMGSLAGYVTTKLGLPESAGLIKALDKATER